MSCSAIEAAWFWSFFEWPLVARVNRETLPDYD